MTASTARIALVTGANKGVGYAIARQLAEKDHAVWLGARDESRGAAAEAELRAAGLDVRWVALEVTDDASVAAATARIDAESRRLDVLVNNAAVSKPWAKPSRTLVSDVEASLATNVLGYIRVTNAVLPLLRKSSAARIVNISSVIGSLSAASTNHDPTGMFADGEFPVILAHSLTKSAINSLTISYANELRGEAILVNAVSPNWTRTDGSWHTGPFSPEEGARGPVRMATLPDDGPTGTFTVTTAGGGVQELPW